MGAIVRPGVGLCLISLLLLTGCPDGRSASDGGPGVDAGASDGGGPPDGGAFDAGADGGGVPDGGGADAGADGGAGGLAYRGTVLFTESFDDGDFGGRGWYDAPGGTLSTAEAAPGSIGSFECLYRQGEQGCAGGTPGRHEFPSSESVYLSYWVKYSANFVGSERSYHPHEFHFINDQNSRWVGPSYTHLTTYIEQIGGVPRLAIQDGENVDPACVLHNDDNFTGCNGDFASYVFTENRSVSSCNGLLGDLDRRDCYRGGGSTWNSSRAWVSPVQAFGDTPGPTFKNDWHFVEAYFEMNEVVGGVGQIDGRIRYWLDGELLISSDAILMRTGQFPTMGFSQFFIAPHIGDGSPVDQTMWVDELTVATGLK